MEQNKYQIFDGEDEKYRMVVPSNNNIRKVCKVFTECHTLTAEERKYYAEHGDIRPEHDEEKDELIYNFKNKYDQVTVWAALAEVLFFEGPSLLALDDDNNAYVPEEKQEQFDKLIRSEVMRGRDDFLQSFGVTPPEVNELFKSLANAQIPLNMNRLMEAADQAAQLGPSTSETSKTGKTKSSDSSPTGKR